MWFEESVFYQIYPLGFVGAPAQNDSVLQHRIPKVIDWIPHLQTMGVGTVLFNPLFESDAHGYDTRDMAVIDKRLGANEDFAAVCDALHKADIRVMLDGVFNHVGRGFWAFQDVQKNREHSLYKDWFHIDFGGNSNDNDGFWYEGWEGHFDLVKLNLHNPQVVDHLLDCVGGWIDQFGIDGIRLDVAYLLDHGFIRRLRNFVNQKKEDFFLVGEMLHGDYKQIIGPEMLDSTTNYECYKGMHSSLNSMNFYEIAYSFNRQFGPEDWTLYRGVPLLNFVDNHDVTRAASILSRPEHLPLLYGLLFGMPGIPCLYYGSEWGAKGEKGKGSDADLRPAFEKPEENELFDTIQKLCHIRRHSAPLTHGDYRQTYLTNHQYIFERGHEGNHVWVALNASDQPHTAHFSAKTDALYDLAAETEIPFDGELELEPYGMLFLTDQLPE